MTTAIIGVGHLGSALAQHLVRGSEPVVLAAQDQSHAQQLAAQLGPLASAAPVREAISQADTVVLAVWLDKLNQLVAEQSDLLDGKVVVDPTNPVGFDEKGNFVRTLPEHQSSGSVVAELLPPRAHYVKAFGTLGATSLASSANRTPRRVALFYATDDDQAAATVERLISAAGFDPLKAGGVEAAGRIEMPGGDLHESGLRRLLDADEARAAIAAATVA
jgi:8-hydroxy-5-deazaflavin:NADPH oxidoreductase